MAIAGSIIKGTSKIIGKAIKGAKKKKKKIGDQLKKEGKFIKEKVTGPAKQRLKNFGILGEYRIVGTVYILTRKEDVIELENTINKNIVNLDGLSVGTSILPDESGIVIRILGNKTNDISNVIFKILELSRKKILGASISKIRKN